MINLSISSPRRKVSRGFSMVEVVVAVGIFALAIVGVIGLLVPTSKNIVDVADSDSASRVIGAIQSSLQKSPFDFTIVKNHVIGGTKFYASKDGSKLGAETDAVVWPAGQNQEKFFEFTLVRNDGLSPTANDDTSGFLAFTIVLKWPAYVPSAPNADGTPGAGTLVDDIQKSVMVVPVAITR